VPAVPRGGLLTRGCDDVEGSLCLQQTTVGMEAKDADEGDAELECPLVTDAERVFPDTLVSADRNALHPLPVSLKEKERILACVLLASFNFPHFFPFLFL
jgi:hypothetical protein